ncbi:MAG: methyltransferase [Miltoncostaeaceae bacterium]|nr:methyltransferase [Miltoncostaeaceae bacterium]
MSVRPGAKGCAGVGVPDGYGDCMTADPSPQSAVARHYARPDLAEAILSALRQAGVDVDRLRPDDLAGMDELHMRGRQATVELAGKLELGPDTRVLDVGSGIGGPSRYLASVHGCHVTGLDLTEEYCRASTVLAERTGLGGRLRYVRGDALDMPFPDAAFDVVWTQHAAMNIPRKERLYAEMARVVRSGGRLALDDLVAGPAGPPHYPLPWADDPSTSFLVGVDALRDTLERSGFAPLQWREQSEAGLAWFREMASRSRDGAERPPLGPQILFGDGFLPRLANLARSLEEGRLALLQTVCRRVDE